MLGASAGLQGIAQAREPRQAIADGLVAGISKLAEPKPAELKAAMAAELPAAPVLHPNLAKAYADRVAELRRALDADDGTEVLEPPALIDTVVVSPPDDPGEPSTIELTEFHRHANRRGQVRPDDAALNACLTGLLSLAKEEHGSSPPLSRQPCPSRG